MRVCIYIFMYTHTQESHEGNLEQTVMFKSLRKVFPSSLYLFSLSAPPLSHTQSTWRGCMFCFSVVGSGHVVILLRCGQVLACKIHTLKREMADSQHSTNIGGNTNLMVMD
jgi:hypothetical protein